MNILLTVDPELPVPPGLYGGIERIVDALVNNYVEKGHSVTLCANPESKVPCRLIPWKGLKSQVPKDSIRNLITLTSLVYGGKFHVIHSFSRLAYMAAIMPFKIPKIMSYQREPSLAQIKKANALARKGSLIFTGCSKYISSQISQVAEAHTVYNCVPIEKYTAVFKVEEDAPLIFLGRIEEIKGTHLAVEVARNTNRKLIIAGNIPAGKEEYFEEKIKPFLDDRISYVGPVDDNKKNILLGTAAALLMPILWNEPFGIVMAEAMACGTPVLGFPRGSIPEVIEDGVNGFICCDVKEMQEKVVAIPSLSRKAVRQIAEQKFSNTRVANDYLDLYASGISRTEKVKSH